MDVVAVVGRDEELGSVRRFLSDLATGPAALVLSGEPGIGKTILWETARREATGRVLSWRGVEAEAVARLRRPVRAARGRARRSRARPRAAAAARTRGRPPARRARWLASGRARDRARARGRAPGAVGRGSRPGRARRRPVARPLVRGRPSGGDAPTAREPVGVLMTLRDDPGSCNALRARALVPRAAAGTAVARASRSRRRAAPAQGAAWNRAERAELARIVRSLRRESALRARAGPPGHAPGPGERLRARAASAPCSASGSRGSLRDPRGHLDRRRAGTDARDGRGGPRSRPDVARRPRGWRS